MESGVSPKVRRNSEMSFSYIDLHTAKQKMRLKNTNACLSFVNTVWKGEIIMCCFNNLNHEIINIFSVQIIKPEELSAIELIIKEFIFGDDDSNSNKHFGFSF